MSHLSQIKTQIVNTKTLQKTLVHLGCKYSMKLDSKYDMLVTTKNFDSFELLWNGQEYDIFVDLQMWKQDTDVNLLIDQITQRYSYDSIIEESIKHGFTYFNQKITNDGSIKLVVQKWT